MKTMILDFKSKIIIIILLSTLFLSCKSKKVISETIKTDTIYKSEIIKITPSRLSSLNIESPCDSLGKLKPFFYTLGSGNDKIIVKTIDNTISVEQNLDSVKSVWQKEYKSSFETNKKEINVPYIPKWVWYSLALNFLLLVWLFRKPLIRLIKPI